MSNSNEGMVSVELPSTGTCAPSEPLHVATIAFHRLGLLNAQESIDGSYLTEDRVGAYTPLSKSPIPLDQLPQVHSTIYAHRPLIQSVIGVHTANAIAVSKRPQHFRTLSQDTIAFYSSVAFCECVDDVGEVLKTRPTAIAVGIQGKGFFVFGTSVGNAFTTAFYMDRCCRLQLLVGNQPVIEPSEDTWLKAWTQMQKPEFSLGVEWPAVVEWITGNSPARTKLMSSCITSRSAKEESLRMELSQAHKELHRLNFDALIWNHVSAKLDEGILITPGDRIWSLVEPDTLQISSENVTADVLHAAVYSATNSNAVVHTHSPAIEAVSCLKQGLFAAETTKLHGHVAYHPWEGISDDTEECQRLAEAIRQVPGCIAVILQNHGAITFGDTVSEALEHHIALDAACRQQLLNGTQDNNPALMELSAGCARL